MRRRNPATADTQHPPRVPPFVWLLWPLLAAALLAGCAKPSEPAASATEPAASAPANPAAEPISTQGFEDGKLPEPAATADDEPESGAAAPP